MDFIGVFEKGIWKLKNDTLISLFNDYADDYSIADLLEELFGQDVTIGDVLADHYNAGLIPTDKMENFLTDE